MGRVAAVALFLALVAGTWGTSAQASMPEVFGTSSRSQGMGNVGVASASDFSALFYNPALLMDAHNSFSLEMQHGFAELSILLMPRPAGYDPSTYAYRVEPRSDTTGVPSLFGVTVGTKIDFGSDVFAAGVMAFLPSTGIGRQASHFADEREQYFSNQVQWELLGERLQTQTVLVGVAYRAAQWLNLGAGFSFSMASHTNTLVYTPNPADPADVQMNLDISQDSDLALVGGAAVDLPLGLTLGLSFRDEQGFELVGTNTVQLHGLEGKGGYVLEQPLDLVLHYTPRTYAGGLAWEHDGFLAAVDLAWMEWSEYPANNGEPAGFSDAVEVGVGGEFPVAQASVRLGFRYTPSPVPEQTGRTNFADNDRYLVAAGVGGKLSLLGSDVGVDVHVQGLFLPERTHHKRAGASPPPCADAGGGLCDEEAAAGLQTGNPGFPGFTSGGYVLAAGATLTWEF